MTVLKLLGWEDSGGRQGEEGRRQTHDAQANQQSCHHATLLLYGQKNQKPCRSPIAITKGHVSTVKQLTCLLDSNT